MPQLINVKIKSYRATLKTIVYYNARAAHPQLAMHDMMSFGDFWGCGYIVGGRDNPSDDDKAVFRAYSAPKWEGISVMKAISKGYDDRCDCVLLEWSISRIVGGCTWRWLTIKRRPIMWINSHVVCNWVRHIRINTIHVLCLSTALCCFMN